ncbi:10313_t:CDS:2 [Funneliformis geosporum]|nr:10313_t:CDS:2 [Funneliformis geosporum]
MVKNSIKSKLESFTNTEILKELEKRIESGGVKVGSVGSHDALDYTLETKDYITYLNEASGRCLGEELFQPEIVLEKDTGIHKRGLEKYKLKKHPSYDSFYGVDINKESLKSLIKHFKLGIEFRYLDELVKKAKEVHSYLSEKLEYLNGLGLLPEGDNFYSDLKVKKQVSENKNEQELHKELPLIIKLKIDLPVESQESEYNIHEYTFRNDDRRLSNFAGMIEADVADLKKNSIGGTTQFRNVDFNCVRCGYDIEKGTGYYYYGDINQLYNERDDLNSFEPDERLYCEVCSQAKGYDELYRTDNEWRKD